MYNNTHSYENKIFIVSAPSGAGKTVLCRAACKKIHHLSYSISYTTRRPRINEVNGSDYHFINKKEFIRKIEDRDWLEWAVVHGNFYGTSMTAVNQSIISRKDILLDVDIKGARQILKQYPNSITIFVMPPSLNMLERRLRNRRTDDETTIQERLNNAKSEIKKSHLYDYIIVNDNLEQTMKEFISILTKST